MSSVTYKTGWTSGMWINWLIWFYFQLSGLTSHWLLPLGEDSLFQHCHLHNGCKQKPNVKLSISRILVQRL